MKVIFPEVKPKNNQLIEINFSPTFLCVFCFFFLSLPLPVAVRQLKWTLLEPVQGFIWL